MPMRERAEGPFHSRRAAAAIEAQEGCRLGSVLGCQLPVTPIRRLATLTVTVSTPDRYRMFTTGLNDAMSQAECREACCK